MALLKIFETPTGNSGNYWRIDQITINRLDNKMECRINLYKSKAHRADGKLQMQEQQILFLDTPSDSTTIDQLIGDIYTNAKTTPTSDQNFGDTPFFEGAKNV